MGLLNTIGKILALIGGILVLVFIILGLFGAGFSIPGSNIGLVNVGGIIGLIIRILAAVGLIMMYTNRFGIKDVWVEGIVIIILAVIAGSTLALIGGILVFIDGLI